MKTLSNKIQTIDGVKVSSATLSDDGRVNVHILIPHTHPQYSSNFFLAFTGLLSFTYYWNFLNRNNRYAFHIVTPPANLAGIASIRNGLAMVALQDQSDFTFWLDSDQTPPPDALVKMLRHFEESDTLEAVGGLITFKDPPYVPHVYVKKHAAGKSYHLARNLSLDQLFKVEGLGFGCCLIKTTVFNRVAKPWFEFKVDEMGALVSGEDLGFCAKADMEAIIDPTIVVGHFKETIYDINNFIEYNDLKVEDGKLSPSKQKADKIYQEHVSPKHRDRIA